MNDIRLESDPDFILMKRFGFSLARLMLRYPEGAPDSVIAAALGISESEVEKTYQAIVLKLRAKMQAGDSEPIV